MLQLMKSRKTLAVAPWLGHQAGNLMGFKKEVADANLMRELGPV